MSKVDGQCEQCGRPLAPYEEHGTVNQRLCAECDAEINGPSVAEVIAHAERVRTEMLNALYEDAGRMVAAYWQALSGGDAPEDR